MHTIHPKFCDISHFYYYLGIEPYTIVFILVSDLRVMLLQVLYVYLGLETSHAYLVSCSSVLLFTKSMYLILTFGEKKTQKVGLCFSLGTYLR